MKWECVQEAHASIVPYCSTETGGPRSVHFRTTCADIFAGRPPTVQYGPDKEHVLSSYVA
jgi:hypothetical protein